jgi:hypothetical protein
MDHIIKAQISMLKSRLTTNFLLSLLSFLSLVFDIILINLHPHSVWYYFSAGFFTCSLLGLILEKTSIKYQLQDAISTLKRQGFL